MSPVANTKMDELLAGYIQYCCKLENGNEGLTQQFMGDKTYAEVRKLETRGDTIYNSGDYISFVQLITALKLLWNKALIDFKAGNLHRKELF